jgi:hypothetical protein
LLRDPLLTFVVEINPDTLQESEASWEKKANIAKEQARQQRKERYSAHLEHLCQHDMIEDVNTVPKLLLISKQLTIHADVSIVHKSLLGSNMSSRNVGGRDIIQ